MKNVLRIGLSAILFGFLSSSCTEEPISILKDLNPIFSSDEYSVEAGGTVSLPFSIANVEGASLTLSATTSHSEATATIQHDNLYSGTVDFTAPAVSSGETVTVTLKVVDSENNREASTTTNVVVGASEALAISLTADIRSMATKAGGQFDLPFTITGIGKAEIASEVDLTVTDGWQATCNFNSDRNGGNIRITAPAALTSQLSVKLTVKDNYDRSATLETVLSIVEVSTSENAANCYIVAPGSTVTIKAVEGNSADELSFNNAALVWQDALGMVKSVSASSADKVVVVELNAGVTGNAVVAARMDGVIVWSWHLWVTDYNPDENPMVWKSSTSGTTYTFMDRNLGAKSNEKSSPNSFGLFYQWGRKDPFVGADGLASSVYVKKYDIDGNIIREVSELRPVYDDYTTTNLQLSIQNPTTFYYAPSSAWPVVDWLTDDAQLQNNDLWGGTSGYKTKYDPCPEGWIVPPAGDPWGFRKEYSKTGSLTDSNKYDPSYPWYIDYDEDWGFRYKAAGSETEYWFPFCGRKDCNSGDLASVGSGADIHTRSVQNTTALIEIFAWGNPTSETGLNRPYGAAVRCIKE